MIVFLDGSSLILVQIAGIWQKKGFGEITME